MNITKDAGKCRHCSGTGNMLVKCAKGSRPMKCIKCNGTGKAGIVTK